MCAPVVGRRVERNDVVPVIANPSAVWWCQVNVNEGKHVLPALPPCEYHVAVPSPRFSSGAATAKEAKPKTAAAMAAKRMMKEEDERGRRGQETKSEGQVQ